MEGHQMATSVCTRLCWRQTLLQNSMGTWKAIWSSTDHIIHQIATMAYILPLYIHHKFSQERVHMWAQCAFAHSLGNTVCKDSLLTTKSCLIYMVWKDYRTWTGVSSMMIMWFGVELWHIWQLVVRLAKNCNWWIQWEVAKGVVWCQHLTVTLCITGGSKLLALLWPHNSPAFICVLALSCSCHHPLSIGSTAPFMLFCSCEEGMTAVPLNKSQWHSSMDFRQDTVGKMHYSWLVTACQSQHSHSILHCSYL